MEPTPHAKLRGRKPTLTKPISIRFTEEEVAELKHLAGELSVSEYIRKILFRNNAAKLVSNAASSEVRLTPQTRQKLLAQILMRLGTLDSIHTANELMTGIQCGLIDASPELITALNHLQAEFTTLRCDLLNALGLRPSDSEQ